MGLSLPVVRWPLIAHVGIGAGPVEMGIEPIFLQRPELAEGSLTRRALVLIVLRDTDEVALVEATRSLGARVMGLGTKAVMSTSSQALSSVQLKQPWSAKACSFFVSVASR
jgi:hypothetical protein